MTSAQLPSRVGNEGERVGRLVSGHDLCLSYMVCSTWFSARPRSEEAQEDREFSAPEVIVQK